MSFPIKAAIESNCFDKIIVSTDDEEIAELAMSLGAEVPFIRPTEISDDFTGIIPVMRDAIEKSQFLYGKIDYACCIYATSPLISDKDLAAGYNAIQKSGCDYAFSVTSYAFPIQRAIKINTQGNIAMFYPEHFITRSQDLEEAWHDAGQFYWGTADAWCKERPIFEKRSLPIKVPRYRVQDLDTLEDWYRAELMFRILQADGNQK